VDGVTVTLDDVPVRKAVKLVAAVVVGLGVGTSLKASVALPAVGAVPGFVPGGLAVLVGAVAYTQAPGSAAGCGCDGDCDCS
jgi:hypothetical protein